MIKSDDSKETMIRLDITKNIFLNRKDTYYIKVIESIIDVKVKHQDHFTEINLLKLCVF